MGGGFHSVQELAGQFNAGIRGLPSRWREEMAEGVGFEPTDGHPSPVFKTGAFGHSATPPMARHHTGAPRPVNRWLAFAGLPPMMPGHLADAIRETCRA